MYTKLTLRLDENLIRRAKSYSKSTGRSVSQMVADYFSLIDAEPSQESELTPMARSLKGALRCAGVSEEDHRQYLEDRYL